MQVTRLLSTAVAVISIACSAMASSPATAQTTPRPSDSTTNPLIICGGERQYILDMDKVFRYVYCDGQGQYVIDAENTRRYLTDTDTRYILR